MDGGGEADPEETRNLYQAPERRETVEQCRSQLLEWLIQTTRIRTDWGVHGLDNESKFYPDAGDGRMPAPVQFGFCRNHDAIWVFFKAHPEGAAD